MARTALAIQDVPNGSAAQLTTATPDAANGNIFPNDGNVELIVRNADASSKTVTVTSVPCSHGRAGNIVQVVAAGAVAVLGPFPTDLFSQKTGADAGSVYVDWSASTSVTVAARRRT